MTPEPRRGWSHLCAMCNGTGELTATIGRVDESGKRNEFPQGGACICPIGTGDHPPTRHKKEADDADEA